MAVLHGSAGLQERRHEEPCKMFRVYGNHSCDQYHRCHDSKHREGGLGSAGEDYQSDIGGSGECK